jgi:hypothetical protein
VTQHRARTRRSSWPGWLIGWRHWAAGPGPRPSSRMPVTGKTGYSGQRPQNYPRLEPGDLLTMESWTTPGAAVPELAAHRCLVCEGAIGYATCRLLALTVIPDGLPTTWGLPSRTYLVHATCPTTDPVALHWAAHLRECPGCPCKRTRLMDAQEQIIPSPAAAAGQ